MHFFLLRRLYSSTPRIIFCGYTHKFNGTEIVKYLTFLVNFFTLSKCFVKHSNLFFFLFSVFSNYIHIYFLPVLLRRGSIATSEQNRRTYLYRYLTNGEDNELVCAYNLGQRNSKVSLNILSALFVI